MPFDGKTWLKSEIIALIETELTEYREDCVTRGRQRTDKEAAELIYASLDAEGLIEDTP